MKKIFKLSVLSAALLLATVYSDAPGQIVEAYTRPASDRSLALTVSGRIASVTVNEGQAVEPGDILIQLDDAEGEAQIQLLELRSMSTLEADAAMADLKLAQVRKEMILGASERGGASSYELREVQQEVERARLAHELFLQRREESELQLLQAKRRHEKYTLTARASGVVERIVVENGETVEALEPVLQIVSTAELTADAQAPTTATLHLEVGDELPLVFLLGEDRRQGTARIEHLASVADAASDTRRVRVRIPNPKDLPAGTRVLIDFSEGENR